MIADVTLGMVLPYLGGLVRVLFALSVARATLVGEARPSWVSWSVWTATTGLSTVTSILAGAPLAAVVPGAAFIQCSTLLVATLISRRRFPDDREPTTNLEWVCLAMAGVSFLIWQLSGDPVIGLGAAIATDAVASGPTWALAWQGREAARNWFGGMIAALSTFVVQQGYALADWAYPTYELYLCGLLLFLILLRKASRPVIREAHESNTWSPLPWVSAEPIYDQVHAALARPGHPGSERGPAGHPGADPRGAGLPQGPNARRALPTV